MYSAFQGGYTNGVGVGGNPAAVAGASGNAGGPGFVKIKYILDKTFERESRFLHFLLPPLPPSFSSTPPQSPFHDIICDLRSDKLWRFD